MNFRKRKTVIVNNFKMNIIKDPLEMENLDAVMLEKNGLDTKEENLDTKIHPMNLIEIVKLDIESALVNAMYTDYLAQLDQYYLDTIQVKYDKAWKEKGLGERVMNDFISICKANKEHTADFYQLIRRLFR